MPKLLPGINGISGKTDDQHAFINGKKISIMYAGCPKKRKTLVETFLYMQRIFKQHT